MKRIHLLFVLLAAMLSGCATVTPNFSVKKQFWDDKTKSVGIAVVKLPQAQTHKIGNQGLLDLAINNAVAGELDTHLKNQDISGIKDMLKNISTYLGSKGYKVVQINEEVDLESYTTTEQTQDSSSGDYFAGRDLKAMKAKHGVDKLVLLSVDAIGTVRNYYGFFPIGAPSGYCQLSGQIIDLNNNRLEWNQTVRQTTPNSEPEWDVPPSYPGLTKAMKMAYTQAQNLLMNHFSQ